MAARDLGKSHGKGNKMEVARQGPWEQRAGAWRHWGVVVVVVGAGSVVAGL